MCPECKAMVNVKECFKDRAALMEVKVLSLLCRNDGCTWEGIVDDYQVNYYVCMYTTLHRLHRHRKRIPFVGEGWKNFKLTQ